MWVRMDDFHPITFGRKVAMIILSLLLENSCILYDYYDPT
ncbi:hypothetical protein TrRE_jg8276, partial [Triparma retinervis]